MNLSQLHKRYEKAEKALIEAVADAYVGAIREVLESCRLPRAEVPVEVAPVARVKKGQAKPKKNPGRLARIERHDEGFRVIAADGRVFASKYYRNIQRIIKREGLKVA